MNSSEKVWLTLWEMLYEVSDKRELYVYRMDGKGKTIKPYLLKGVPYPELPEVLRDDFGGGEFKILIRERRKMVFSGEIAIEPNGGLTPPY